MSVTEFREIADELLTRKETAAILRVKPQTMSIWAMSGRHLPYVRVGGRAMYRKADVKRYLAQNTVQPAD